MYRRFFSLWVGVLFVCAAFSDGRKVCMDDDWKYHFGAVEGAYAADFDDSGWRSLNLPHDWSVETDAAEAAGGTTGCFVESAAGSYSTGYTVGGVAWYRRAFVLDEDDLEGRVLLYFEGAYNYSDVWLNGRKIYFNHYGYQSFRFDITEFCAAAGEENVLAVKVTNEGLNTRWYAGSGIYRHVWLIRTPVVHLDSWQTVVTTPVVGASGATVRVSTRVFNEGSADCDADVRVTIYDGDGRSVGSERCSVEVGGHGCAESVFELGVSDPSLWSPSSPVRYRAVVSAAAGDSEDEISVCFGIRSIEVSAEDGFVLNGEKIYLYGGCVHHDNGLLGSAAVDAAEDRKLSLLKAEGFNAVRTSHNLPSEHFLDACDSIGLMVVEESFDQWLIAKNSDDYHQFFEEFSDRDIQVMVLRDRNHPSVVMWSLGNEIPGRITGEGQKAAARLRETILKLDDTRPITSAIPSWDSYSHSWADDSQYAFSSLDVGGYNYLYDKYESDHEDYPDRVMVGLESYPKRTGENWNLVEGLPYVIGDFVWTAFDYLGEAGIGSSAYRKSGSQPFSPGWPWFNGFCGDIDLIGEKKPQSYYRDVVWRRRAVTMGVEEPVPSGSYMSISAWGWQLEHQSWTYDCEEGTVLTVNVYSRSPQVRLYLNGDLIGTAATSSTFWAGFSVPYAPGTLRAVEFDGENEGESFELVTTGEPVGLRLKVDRSRIKADGKDLAYVTAELVDDEGRVVSDSTRRVYFSVEGVGSLVACGNASPRDMGSFRNDSPLLFEGRAQAVVQSGRMPGCVMLTVESDEFDPQTITIETGAEDETAVGGVAGTYKGGFTAEVRNRRIVVSGTDEYGVFDAAGRAFPRKGRLKPGVYFVCSGEESLKVFVQ